MPRNACPHNRADLFARIFALASVAVLAALAVSGVNSAAASAASPEAEPPALPAREIKPSPGPPPGTTVLQTNEGAWATLFLPDGWRVPPDGRAQLVVHFHTVAWFTIKEHLRRSATPPLPLLNFALGEGSATYSKPFQRPEHFQSWLRVVEKELVDRGAPTHTRIVDVDISSFSAGYGAVREILKLATNQSVIRRIVLCDSLYGGLATTNGLYPHRLVQSEHIEPWRSYAEAAVRGEKFFLLTTSDIETSRYASTRECGSALAAAVGATFTNVSTNAGPAARDPVHPLIRRADLGRFHVWNYAGTNAQAHLAHVRHLAELWPALDTDVTNSPTRR